MMGIPNDVDSLGLTRQELRKFTEDAAARNLHSYKHTPFKSGSARAPTGRTEGTPTPRWRAERVSLGTASAEGRLYFSAHLKRP